MATLPSLDALLGSDSDCMLSPTDDDGEILQKQMNIEVPLTLRSQIKKRGE